MLVRSTLMFVVAIILHIICSTKGIVAGIILVDLLLFIYVVLKFIKPIMKLHESVKDIDFDADIVDLSLIDNLEIKGNAQLKVIIEKFKYLVDIIDDRINKVNDERYNSEHDELSGCYNRLHLKRLQGTYESSNDLCIIFFDVNNLKKMNDIYGHEAGDALIKNAAKHIKFWDKYGDVYRTGGDEFMVVILNQTERYIMNIFNQWYPNVGQLNRGNDEFKCLLSYGISFSDEDSKSFELLEKQADDAMYKYKVNMKKKLGESLR